MRKTLGIIISLISLFFLSAVRTSAATYKNVITDDTIIEEDFQVLGIEISDYYIPTVYDYAKFYVVAMSEAYIENNNIQTYFYFYNPYRGQEIQIDNFEYSYNSTTNIFSCNIVTPTSSNGLYKVKGFTYPYEKDTEIKITKINGACISRDSPDIFSDPQEYIIELSSESGFKAKNSHSLVDGQAFTCELNFNSTLILEEYEAVDVYIPRDDRGFFNSIANLWDDIWLGTKELWLTFYNFNFPKNIRPDSIEYAKFSYNVNYNQKHMINGKIKSDVSSTKKELKEYTPGTHTFQANGRSEELTFETFVLGDRIKKGEFGYLEFTEEAKKKFNYDASILLDSRINTFSTTMINEYTSSTIIKNTLITDIEFLELHYKKDGILYKCQIISQPIDPTPVRPTVELPWWQKVLLWLGKGTVHLFSPQTVWPDLGYMIVGGVELLILLVVSILLLPHIISFLINIILLPITILTKIFKL